jgi:hypothetical protein
MIKKLNDILVFKFCNNLEKYKSSCMVLTSEFLLRYDCAVHLKSYLQRTTADSINENFLLQCSFLLGKWLGNFV